MRKNKFMMMLISTLFTLMAFTLATQTAQAHSLPINNGTINVNDNTAYLVLSLPIHALKNVDDNGDGKLSYTEYKTHEQSINKQIESGFTFINQRADSESSQPLTVISLTRAVEEDSESHSHEPMSQSALEKLQATHLTTLAVVRFPKTIGKLQVNSDFFKTAAPDYQFTLFAKHAAPATEAAQSKPKREQATLSATDTTAIFFDAEKRTNTNLKK